MIRYFALLTVLFTFSACREKVAVLNPGHEPEVLEVRLPSEWNLYNSSGQKIEAQVADPQGNENISQVTLTIRNSSGAAVYSFLLYDDGRVLHAEDGDVLAGDGFYSNMLLPSAVTTDSGDFQFEISVLDHDGHLSPDYSGNFHIGKYAVPQIEEFNTPAILISGSVAQPVTVTVSSAAGIDQVTAVKLWLLTLNAETPLLEINLFNDGNLALHGDAQAGDSVFSVLIDSSFAAGRKGNYRLRTAAFNTSGDPGPSATAEIELENTAPQILALSVPETINRPAEPGVFNRDVLTARVRDEQSLADIDQVYFYSRKPDGTYANNGQPFLLKDNGLAFDINNLSEAVGDETAGDGEFTYSLLINSEAQTGWYRFEFYSRDKVGQVSVLVADSIEVK